MNMRERITELKRKQNIQKVALAKRHGQQLMELYNLCDHEFGSWVIDPRKSFLTLYEIRICSECKYTESRIVK